MNIHTNISKIKKILAIVVAKQVIWYSRSKWRWTYLLIVICFFSGTISISSQVTQCRIILLLQPITKLYLFYNRTKITGWFPVLPLKNVLRTFSTVPLNSAMPILLACWYAGIISTEISTLLCVESIIVEIPSAVTQHWCFWCKSNGVVLICLITPNYYIIPSCLLCVIPFHSIVIYMVVYIQYSTSKFEAISYAVYSAVTFSNCTNYTKPI